MEIFWWNQAFSPWTHQKLISPKWRKNKGGKLVQLVLQNYSLLCYKLLFVLIHFSLFLHLFVFSFYPCAVVKVTCRFFFFSFLCSLLNGCISCLLSWVFFFFNWPLLGFYLFMFLCFNLFFNWAWFLFKYTWWGYYFLVDCLFIF